MTKKTEDGTSRRDFLKIAGTAAPAAVVALLQAQQRPRLNLLTYRLNDARYGAYPRIPRQRPLLGRCSSTPQTTGCVTPDCLSCKINQASKGFTQASKGGIKC